MAHPLKKYARFVQRELSRRPGFEDTSYNWCLLKVQEFWRFAEGQRAPDRKRILLEKVSAVASPRQRKESVRGAVLESADEVRCGGV